MASNTVLIPFYGDTVKNGAREPVAVDLAIHVDYERMPRLLHDRPA
jgi:hypothetical protein